MQFLIITSVCFSFTLFVALFHRVGRSSDKKRRRLMSISGRMKKVFDEDLNVPFLKRFVIPTFYNSIKSFSRLFPNNSQKLTSRLEKNLILAGVRLSSSEYAAMRLVYILAVVGIALILAFVLPTEVILKVLILIGGVFLALGGPQVYLSMKIKSRQMTIRRQLPDILDLLTVSMEAGLSFDGALIYIEQYAQGPLIEEFSVMKREIQMGVPRREALKKLAERNNVEELKTFVGALIQSEQIGIPVRNVLRTQSASLRLSRKQQAEEKAMKAPVKMMVPMIVFVFPVTFIIVLGPTVLNLIKTFS